MITKEKRSIYNHRWYEKHGKEYYYNNQEKKIIYNRIKQTEYRRKKGILLKELCIGKNHHNWKGGRRKCIDCENFVASRKKRIYS